MTAIRCPGSFVTGDGKEAGLGSKVYAVLQDGVTLSGGPVVALLYDGPLDKACGWVAVDAGGGPGLRQWKPWEVYSDGQELAKAALAAAIRRRVTAEREAREAAEAATALTAKGG